MQLIEAASAILDEEGYPAFTVRRIAGKAGVKPQLLHYYFRSMEELVVIVFQRSCASYFQMHDEALSSPRPLRALWKLNCDLPEARRVLEYVALAKIYPALRAEMRAAGMRFRALQIEAIETVCAQRGITHPPMNAPALAALMSAVARNIVIEGNVSMTAAHDDVRAFMDQVLAAYEPRQPVNP
ncbi:TetR family transcriptional regulator [Novosphingobium endophyticum]|uniref:TetR family transcriptional regulator n=1 Tax=Novosphingobium endophyticum TaxID=1955250 RepID=A0A916TQ13_9SPHN|nr:TetR family transcriptional regulator [Novosphingobium endophyticum]